VRRTLFAAAILAGLFLLAGCAVGGGTKTTTVTVTVRQKAPSPHAIGALAQTQDARYFGVPVSLTKVDATRYTLLLKPEFFLVGIAAKVVFADQQGTQCDPLVCPGVPDDRLVIPAGKQLLTFVVPARAKGTVITVGNGQMRNTTVTGAELATLVDSNPKRPKLVEPLDSGLWLTVDVDKVTSFAQQFQP
jgi:hypothetical protein